MSASLEVRSELPPISWEVFKDTHPLGSIALDGYVSDSPQYDPDGPYLNANHHENVNRLATLSTAQQILMGMRMGLVKAFTQEGVFAPSVFVNDCDQDVCAAWYLLANVEQAKTVTNPALNRFINVAGTLDVTSGAFPYDPDARILGELAWVFEPYTSFRMSGEMAKKDNAQYQGVIEDVGHRIGKHLVGSGESIPLDTRYKIVGGGKDWKMIEEVGSDGKVGALMDGIDAYISVQQTGEESWRYTIGRRSEFIPFNIPLLLDVLNEAEKSAADKWGGATIIGGSPRVGDSKLAPPEVEHLLNETLG